MELLEALELETFLTRLSPFEIGMLICWGVSWPLSVYKMWKTKVSAGKSFAFLGLVLLGYVLGTLHKIFFHLDAVVLLYMFNGAVVLLDIILSYRYRDNTVPIGR